MTASSQHQLAATPHPPHTTPTHNKYHSHLTLLLAASPATVTDDFTTAAAQQHQQGGALRGAVSHHDWSLTTPPRCLVCNRDVMSGAGFATSCASPHPKHVASPLEVELYPRSGGGGARSTLCRLATTPCSVFPSHPRRSVAAPRSVGGCCSRPRPVHLGCDAIAQLGEVAESIPRARKNGEFQSPDRR